MTKKETIKAIKALGLVAVWSVDWQEFIINYSRRDNRYTPDSSYHTEDSQDAIDTAKRMAAWKKV